MLYSLSYQMYRQEHGLETAAERRAADARAGTAAAALGDLRLIIGRVLRPRDRGRPADKAANAATAPARVMSSAR